MKALVIGGSGYIGKALVWTLRARGWDTTATTRETCNLLDLPTTLPYSDVVYICAAMTRFIDCEANDTGYRVNVDGPIRIAELCHVAKIIYLSSEAVERALHTNYGMHKALAELGLRSVCKPVIVRLSKVSPEHLDRCCEFLADVADRPAGLYWWSETAQSSLSSA